LLSAILLILNNENVSGKLNFCAPESVRQGDFAKTLGKILCRPAILPAPAFVLRTVLGEFGATLLSSQKAVPSKLSEYGFTFKYPDIQSAFEEITGKRG
jgi:NAD dependent epimerase/dehydratase family enzyme